MHDAFLVWVLVGVLGLGAILWLVLHRRGDRYERRRRRSHRRIVSTSRRPTVKFSVRPPKDE